MEFYLSVDGEKQGPFPVMEVGDMLDSGTVTPETLAWTRDQEGWLPINEIPALEAFVTGKEGPEPPETTSAPLPDPGEDSQMDMAGAKLVDGPAIAVGVRETRPFLRFWARMFDLMLVMTIVNFFVDTGFLMPGPDESFSDWFARYTEALGSPETIAIANTFVRSLIGWHLVEAALIYLFGTTPGKALFGIRVANTGGGPILPLRSLGRSLYVYLMGVGFYLFPFMLIGMIFSFFRMMSTGKCLWDQHLGFEVQTPRPSPRRIVLAIFGFFALLMLQSLKFS
tara:strand:+ start:2077 stop:2922 length:846 start_codon:yes stop_codon:yes gene_type:complete